MLLNLVSVFVRGILKTSIPFSLALKIKENFASIVGVVCLAVVAWFLYTGLWVPMKDAVKKTAELSQQLVEQQAKYDKLVLDLQEKSDQAKLAYQTALLEQTKEVQMWQQVAETSRKQNEKVLAQLKTYRASVSTTPGLTLDQRNGLIYRAQYNALLKASACATDPLNNACAVEQEAP